MMKQNLVFVAVLVCCLQFGTLVAKPLKILCMLGAFPTLSMTFVVGQITGLIDQGHDVAIFAQQKVLPDKVHPDIEKYRLLDKTYFQKLPDDIGKYDVLYCQFFSLAKQLRAQFSALKKRAGQCPKIVVACCGSDQTEDMHQDDKACRELFELVDLFLPVCDYFKNMLLRAGCDERKIVVHYPAINVRNFAHQSGKLFPSDHITLLSVSRLTESKGIEYALQAFLELYNKFPQLRYVIIGDGQQRKHIKKFVDAHGLANEIALLGWCSPEEVATWMQKADILVHPSVTSSKNQQEGIPNVLIEAMASGLPIVSTWHGGIPELVQHEQTGFLVPERDVRQLIEKITFLIKNSEARERMGIVVRNFVLDKYDICKRNATLEELLCKACS